MIASLVLAWSIGLIYHISNYTLTSRVVEESCRIYYFPSNVAREVSIWNQNECCMRNVKHPEGGSTDSDLCDNCKEFWLEFTMVVYEKTSLNKTGRVVCKLILQKYTWLWIDLSDILVLTVYLGMDQIFTDYPTGSKQKCQKWQKIHAICLLPVG